MTGHTVIINSPQTRDLARKYVDIAPPGAVFNIREADRTKDQNARLWAMLTDISRAQPEGRQHRPEVWKCIFMNALGHQTQFVEGLEGELFPIGFKSSRLNKRQFSELIEYLFWYGAKHDIRWSEPCEVPA